MGTVRTAITLLQLYVNSVNNDLAQLETIIDQIAAINPAAANANTQLVELETLYQSTKNTLTAKSDRLWKDFSEEVDSLTEAEKTEVYAAQPANSNLDAVIARRNVVYTRYQTTITSKRAAITAAGPPAPKLTPTPTISPNTTPAPTILPEPGNINNLVGTADGDNGEVTTNPTGQPINKQATKDPTKQDQSIVASSKGTPANASTATTSNNTYTNENFSEISNNVILPGRRLKNPLGNLASYTYQLSLYMISPDAYEAFVANGKNNINIFSQEVTSVTDPNATNRANSKVVLIAQSGGINPDLKDVRAPGFDLDYYIDKLKMKHMISLGASASSVFTTNISFEITEPYGFSFLNNLKTAQEVMNKKFGGVAKSATEASKQFFILGVRFYGWDQSGRPVTGSEIINGTELDPNAPGTGALFETFYELVIHTMKFKIAGSAVTYQIEGVSTSSIKGSNIKRGIVTSSKEVTGTTVRDALVGPNGLLTKLNEEQENLVDKTNSVAIKYKIEWVGDAKDIAYSMLKTNADTNKDRQPPSNAKDTTTSTAAVEIKTVPNNNAKRISVGSNMPIVQAIDQIVSQSSFLEDSLKFTYTDEEENDPKTKDTNKSTSSARTYLRWFTVSPKISNIQWDPKLNDWAYDITYQIQTYFVPSIENPYIAKKANYYGPHKRYDYWYTGQNTEIIRYEQILDNAFYNVILTGNPDPDKKDDTGVSIATNVKPDGDQTGAGNSPRLDAQNSVKTTLYDPNGQVTATVEILGDPDFLVQDTPAEVNGVFNRFYGINGYTVNPTSGQVFFEIDFKEAVDYSTSSVDIKYGNEKGITGQGGTLAINDSIAFFDQRYTDTTQEGKLVNGLRYLLTEIDSTFAGGSFRQILTGRMVPISEYKTKFVERIANENRENENSTGGSPSNSTATTENTGTKQDVKTGTDSKTPSNNVQQTTTPAIQGNDDDNPKAGA